MRSKTLETGCYNGINQILDHYIDMKWLEELSRDFEGTLELLKDLIMAFINLWPRISQKKWSLKTT